MLQGNEDDCYFEDSDRFDEEESLSSYMSGEEVAWSWRGWKRPQALLHGPQQCKRLKGNVASLTELAAKTVAHLIPFELVECHHTPVPIELQKCITFWSFPENEDNIRLYSCISNGNADEFIKGENLLKVCSISNVIQIGFQLSGEVSHADSTHGRCNNVTFSVSVTFDRRRISSCSCTCVSDLTWCSHVVALCLYRIHNASCIETRAPISESLSRLHRDQLQKFAQYLISELPRQILPTAQRLLDELLKDPDSQINIFSGAPDPTAGPSISDPPIWRIEDSKLNTNIVKLLTKFMPLQISPTISNFDSVYESTLAPPASSEFHTLLRPIRDHEPEGMWNLLSIVREMFSRQDRNALMLLDVITQQCVAFQELVIWWFTSRTSAHYNHSQAATTNRNYCTSGSVTVAAQQACASLMDEIVSLWKLAVLNPILSESERKFVGHNLRLYHVLCLDRIQRCKGHGLTYKKTDPLMFHGFKPAIQATIVGLPEEIYSNRANQVYIFAEQFYIYPRDNPILKEAEAIYSRILAASASVNEVAANNSEDRSAVTPGLDVTALSLAINEEQLNNSEKANDEGVCIDQEIAAAVQLHSKEQSLLRNVDESTIPSTSCPKSGDEGVCIDQEIAAAIQLKDTEDSLLQDSNELHEKPNDEGVCIDQESSSEVNSKNKDVPFNLKTSSASFYQSCSNDSPASSAANDDDSKKGETSSPHQNNEDECELSDEGLVDDQGDSCQIYLYDTNSSEIPSTSTFEEQPNSNAPKARLPLDYFSDLDQYSETEVLFMRAESLHAHNYILQAQEVAVKLANSLLNSPPDLMSDPPPHTKFRRRLRYQLSAKASNTLSKIGFVCSILSDSDHVNLAFRLALFGLELARLPSPSKLLEVKMYHQELELLNHLRRFSLDCAELEILRSRARSLAANRNPRGDYLLPLTSALFIFETLTSTDREGSTSKPGKTLRGIQSTDANLALDAATAVLGMKSNVAEGDYPLLCESARRGRGDLSIALLLHYRDDAPKCRRALDALLDKDCAEAPACYPPRTEILKPSTPKQTISDDEDDSGSADSRQSSPSRRGSSQLAASSDSNSCDSSQTGTEGTLFSRTKIDLRALALSNAEGPVGKSTSYAIRWSKGKRRYNNVPTQPNQPSIAMAHFLMELAKQVMKKAGPSPTAMVFNLIPTVEQQTHTGPHRGLQMAAFEIGLHALGIHNCCSPNWLSRTYSTYQSWIQNQAVEIGYNAIMLLVENWEGHLTPTEVAATAERASRAWDQNTKKAATELTLSVLPFAHALKPQETIKALNQCKDHSADALEKACRAVEEAAQGGGVYPEVLFYVSRHCYCELHEQLGGGSRSGFNCRAADDDGNNDSPTIMPSSQNPNQYYLQPSTVLANNDARLRSMQIQASYDFVQQQIQQYLQQQFVYPAASIPILSAQPPLIIPAIPQVSQQPSASFETQSGVISRHLTAAYRVGMLALETLGKRCHEDKSDNKFNQQPLHPHLDDLTWLLRLAFRLNQGLQFCVAISKAVVNPFTLLSLSLLALDILTPQPNGQISRSSIITPLGQKCISRFIECIHHKLSVLQPSTQEDLFSTLIQAQHAFLLVPGGYVQYSDFLQSIRRAKTCSPELWSLIMQKLQPTLPPKPYINP